MEGICVSSCDVMCLGEEPRPSRASYPCIFLFVFRLHIKVYLESGLAVTNLRIHPLWDIKRVLKEC